MAQALLRLGRVCREGAREKVPDGRETRQQKAVKIREFGEQGENDLLGIKGHERNGEKQQ